MKNAFDKQNKKEGRVPAVARAMAILKSLALAQSSRGVSELSRELGISKGTVHAILQTLREAGAIEDAPGRKYQLGTFFHELSAGRRGTRSLVERCRAGMERLRDKTGQTVMLGVVKGESLSVVAVTEGPGALRLGASPGVSLPLVGGATGKLAMAWGQLPLPETLRRFTEETITDRERYAREVEEARRTGIALDRGELMRGLAAAAAPVLDGETLQGILFAVGFREELKEEGLLALGKAVGQTARQISEDSR